MHPLAGDEKVGLPCCGSVGVPYADWLIMLTFDFRGGTGSGVHFVGSNHGWLAVTATAAQACAEAGSRQRGERDPVAAQTGAAGPLTNGPIGGGGPFLDWPVLCGLSDR